MRLDWLTVQLVEKLQFALQRDVAVTATINGLRGVSLPGLLEYGCLRHSLNGADSLPPLPQHLLDSDLCRALLEVRSVLGLRADGAQKRPPRRLERQASEFHVIETGEDVDDACEHFLTRFDWSAQGAGFSAQVAHALQGAFCEMAANAAEHAQSEAGALLGYQVMDGAAVFCVVDAGIGVLASLTSHPAYAHVIRHRDALRTAFQDGVSRHGPRTRGLGFRQVFKSLADQWGHLRFRTGEVYITMQGHDFNADLGGETFLPPLPGFQVTVCCRTGGDIPADPLV